jgi:hypothetical protein
LRVRIAARRICDHGRRANWSPDGDSAGRRLPCDTGIPRSELPNVQPLPLGPAHRPEIAYPSDIPLVVVTGRRRACRVRGRFGQPQCSRVSFLPEGAALRSEDYRCCRRRDRCAGRQAGVGGKGANNQSNNRTLHRYTEHAAAKPSAVRHSRNKPVSRLERASQSSNIAALERLDPLRIS